MRTFALLVFGLTIPLLYVDASGVVAALPLIATVPILALLATAKPLSVLTLALLTVEIVSYGAILWFLATKLARWVARMSLPARQVVTVLLLAMPVAAALLPIYFVVQDERGPHSGFTLYAWVAVYASMLLGHS